MVRALDDASYDPPELEQVILMSQEQFISLIKPAKVGDINAVNQIVRGSIALVMLASKDYAPEDMSPIDLGEGGTISIIRAINTFDENSGYGEFITGTIYQMRKTITQLIERRAEEEERGEDEDVEIAPDLLETLPPVERAIFERQNKGWKISKIVAQTGFSKKKLFGIWEEIEERSKTLTLINSLSANYCEIIKLKVIQKLTDAVCASFLGVSRREAINRFRRARRQLMIAAKNEDDPRLLNFIEKRVFTGQVDFSGKNLLITPGDFKNKTLHLLNGLKQEYCEVIQCRVVQRISNNDCAAVLGITSSSTSSKFHNARKALLKMVKNGGNPALAKYVEEVFFAGRANFSSEAPLLTPEDFRNKTLALIVRLEPKYRNIIERRVIQGINRQKCATALGLSISQTRSLLSCAKRRLLNAAKKEGNPALERYLEEKFFARRVNLNNGALRSPEETVRVKKFLDLILQLRRVNKKYYQAILYRLFKSMSNKDYASAIGVSISIASRRFKCAEAILIQWTASDGELTAFVKEVVKTRTFFTDQERLFAEEIAYIQED